MGTETSLFGIDLDTLVEDGIQSSVPGVAGRVAHIDGDFIAYQVSFNEERTWEELVHNLEVAVETQRILCGAERVLLHLTANSSTKGGRFEQARLKPYQETRKKEKPSRLEDVRKYMRDNMQAMYWKDREADDGMALYQTSAIAKGERHLSVIVSADKDLRMVQGLHLCPDTHDIVDVCGYGSLFLKEMKSGKKLLGWGNAFFWAQMLMGDSADNISGLPKYVTLTEDGDMDKAKACGPVMAYNLLDGCKDSHEACERVIEVYARYGDTIGFIDYRNKAELSWREALKSEARLLWMRTDEYANPDDYRNAFNNERLS